MLPVLGGHLGVKKHYLFPLVFVVRQEKNIGNERRYVRA